MISDEQIEIDLQRGELAESVTLPIESFREILNAFKAERAYRRELESELVDIAMGESPELIKIICDKARTVLAKKEQFLGSSAEKGEK